MPAFECMRIYANIDDFDKSAHKMETSNLLIRLRPFAVCCWFYSNINVEQGEEISLANVMGYYTEAPGGGGETPCCYAPAPWEANNIQVTSPINSLNKDDTSGNWGTDPVWRQTFVDWYSGAVDRQRHILVTICRCESLSAGRSKMTEMKSDV